MTRPLKEVASKHTLYMRKWRVEHPENYVYMRAKNAEYAKNPEFVAAGRARATALRLADPALTKKRKAADHQKHKDKRLNSEENLQMAHPRCNRLKGATVGFTLLAEAA